MATTKPRGFALTSDPRPLDVEQLLDQARRAAYTMTAAAKAFQDVGASPAVARAERLRIAADVWIDVLQATAGELTDAAALCEQGARKEA